MPEGTIGEAAACYAFMGWLLTQDEIASHLSVQQASSLVKQYCKAQGWSEPPEGWQRHIKPCKQESHD